MSTIPLRFDTEQDWLSALTVNWQRLGSAALQKRGVFNVALAAGAAPEIFYRALSQVKWPWSATRLFVSDERQVSPDHPASRHRAIYRAFYPLAVNLERWKTELPKAGDTAADYERRLIRDLGQPPRFDLMVLNLGADGHAAALFPGTKALQENTRHTAAHWVPQQDAQCLTITYPVLRQAGEIWLLAKGADVQPMTRRMEQAADPDYPATVIVSERGAVKLFNCMI
ncbi:MAG: 6-phosphogluconolactonase [Verrucomicrobiales bacterium]|jgi:6-phosphogluconolactonase|nr:6-phosphogluconolactonase [Verrucomicrobiales bacterium]